MYDGLREASYIVNVSVALKTIHRAIRRVDKVNCGHTSQKQLAPGLNGLFLHLNSPYLRTTASQSILRIDYG